MRRGCARPGCSQGADATLHYRYAARTVFLERLSDDAHPMTHDMCEMHADTIRVPQGWKLIDRRVVVTEQSDVNGDSASPSRLAAG